MQSKSLFSGFFVLISFLLFAGTNPTASPKDKNAYSPETIQQGINYLNKYMLANNVWQSENPEILKLVKGLVHFAEDDKIDSVLVRLDRFQQQKNIRYINRSAKSVSDSLQVKGYLHDAAIREKMNLLDREIWNVVNIKAIPLPESLQEKLLNRPTPIVLGDEKAILERTGIVLPDSLKNLIEQNDSTIKQPTDSLKITNRNTLRNNLIESARQKYNYQIQKENLDSVITAYKNDAVRAFSRTKQAYLRDSLKQQNEQILNIYNDLVVRAVNDSIDFFLNNLKQYAQNDSVSIWVHNQSRKPTQVWFQNKKQSINRLYVKNLQNDSLAIRLMNIDKHSLGIAIDDENVTFNRLVQKQRRDYVFEKFTPEKKLGAIKKKYDIQTPWNLGGNGQFGFTQTSLSNWKSGGKSSFSFLMVLKGYANYADNKLRWENSGELRNGWIRQGGDVNQTQKNDDKFELISRFGISAFDKWFYSGEIDFETQFFNGYNYPDKSKLISAYLSPAKTLIKLGLDYKPNKNFSLFLSPITAKTIFIRDTANVDQTKYGISANSRSLWVPGLNADIKYRIDISKQISYETKCKMFFNYQNPLKKRDINWENTIVAQLTNRINMTFMLNMLYDDDVTFPTGKLDVDGKEIFEPKWQTKELTTIGLSYKINKQIYKRKKID